MEYHHQDNTSWVTDAERWICQIQGVRQCKIDLDSQQEITGVHVVASAERDPRHVVRDVEGLLKARLNIDVYYKKIGVVQIVDVPKDREVEGTPNDPAADKDAKTVHSTRPFVPVEIGNSAVRPALLVEETPQVRLECASVGLSCQGPVLTANVELAWGNLGIHCSESGPDHPGTDIALLARATLSAISRLVEDPITLSLGSIEQTVLAGDDLIVVAVDLVESRRSERFYGICSQRHNRHQSTVFAVLDALNRRLAQMSLKERI